MIANRVNFTTHPRGKYKLKSTCKRCIAEYDKQHSKTYYQDNKEQRQQYNKQYYEQNKEQFKEYNKQYYEQNSEIIKQQNMQYYEQKKDICKQRKKNYYNTPQGQTVYFNSNVKRKQRKEEQGAGITGEQWKEMMDFFDWKCAYSGKSISYKKNRSIDHIVPLVKGGANEIWNLVPMYRPYNSSKQEKDMMEWYTVQDFYSKEKLDKILAWQEYAYNKWSVK